MQTKAAIEARMKRNALRKQVQTKEGRALLIESGMKKVHGQLQKADGELIQLTATVQQFVADGGALAPEEEPTLKAVSAMQGQLQECLKLAREFHRIKRFEKYAEEDAAEAAAPGK